MSSTPDAARQGLGHVGRPTRVDATARRGGSVDFTFDADQLALQDVARQALRARSTAPTLRAAGRRSRPGSPPSCGAGWSTSVGPGCWCPRTGGAGAGLLETCIVLEQMGRIPLPGPFFSSAVWPPWPPAPSGPTTCSSHAGHGRRAGHGRPARDGSRRPARHGARPGPPQGSGLGGDRAQAARPRRPHRRLGHRGGPERRGGALVPARAPGSSAEPVPDPRPHPQGGRAWSSTRSRSDPLGPAGQPGRRCGAECSTTSAVGLAAETGRGVRPGPRGGDRVRQGAGGVRPADRRLPGGQAPDRRHVPRPRDGPGRRAVRRPGPPTPTRPSGRGPPPWPRATPPRRRSG